jgi:hypothetical protein
MTEPILSSLLELGLMGVLAATAFALTAGVM